MEVAKIDRMLTLIRAAQGDIAAARTGANKPASSAAAATGKVESGGFANALKQSLDSVNETQQSASSLAQAFESGTTTKSLAEVMLATQKAGIAFQATVQVRNKLVQAYQDIMNMSV